VGLEWIAGSHVDRQDVDEEDLVGGDLLGNTCRVQGLTSRLPSIEAMYRT